jgi:NhaP-type Na+/H+ or K+/H+ antiporter
MFGLALILVLGIGAQWLAWRLRIPSILLLLLFGFLAGPVFHWIQPEILLGDLLQPIVSFSVAMILFEGGMSLQLRELRQTGGVVRNLVTIGALTTGVIIAIAARLILGVPWELAALLGAILCVTGPTVIGPLLRHVRPIAPLGSILKWEGIIIDPLGALLAVLVFEAIDVGSLTGMAHVVLVSAFKTAGVGGALGFGFGTLLIILFRKRSVPDHLQSPLTLMLVAAAFVTSNAIQHESGLFTVTVMGIVVANQRSVVIQHIAEFKESLSVLLISTLFIILAARLQLATITAVGWRGPLMLAVLIFIARPLAVAVSTVRSGLTWKQKLFLAWMAPRGIVAAAVASVFALRLRAAGIPQASLLIPVVFQMIVGTVVVYGLTAAWLGRLLELAWPNAQGCLIVGAHSLGLAIGEALAREGIPILMLDTNRHNIAQARLDGLPGQVGSVMSREVLERLDLGGIGRMLAVTSNDEVNSLASLQFARVFGRSEVYQLSPVIKGRSSDTLSLELRGQPLFAGRSYQDLQQLYSAQGKLRRTRITENYPLQQALTTPSGLAIPLFLIGSGGILKVMTSEPLPAVPGDVLISLSPPLPPESAGVEPRSQQAIS